MAAILGNAIPRLWTPPLRDIHAPGASYGLAAIAFARDVLKQPLTPAQEWLAMHGGELLPDGRPRFRRLVCIQGRQSGKSTFLAIMAAFWLYVEEQPIVLGLSDTQAKAAEAWRKVVRFAEDIPALHKLTKQIRMGAGDQRIITQKRCEYVIAASNRSGGRGLSIDRLIMDEARELHTRDAYDAAIPAMGARLHAQAWFLSNAPIEESIVLNELRTSALNDVDERLGLFEWSADPASAPDDPAAWAAANPGLGHFQDPTDLKSEAATAMAMGGETLARFMNERLCIAVTLLDPAIDPGAWTRCLDPGDLSTHRQRVVLALDVSVDGLHATVAAAALMPDGRVRVEIIDAAEGPSAGSQMARKWPQLAERIRPRAMAYLPNGPAASLMADMRPVPGVAIEAVRADMPAVCMSFAEAVSAGRVAHSGDPLLDAHVGAAERLRTRDVWVFSRRGRGHVDALYSVATATWLARTMKPAVGKPRILVAN